MALLIEIIIILYKRLMDDFAIRQMNEPSRVSLEWEKKVIVEKKE